MKYKESCHYSTRLITKLKLLDSKGVLDFALIEKAIYWVKKYHDGQYRKSGEPFYTHPLEVAYMVSDYKLKTDVIVTAILHDIVEDTEVTVGMILVEFGHRISEMVDMLTRDRPDGSKLSVEEILNNAFAKGDKEVLLVKLYDRMHNASTALAKNPAKIKKLVDNTLGNFIVLACYLNVDKQEKKLSELCISLSHINTNCKQHISSFLPQGSYQLPSLDFQNEINHIYNQKL